MIRDATECETLRPGVVEEAVTPFNTGAAPRRPTPRLEPGYRAETHVVPGSGPAETPRASWSCVHGSVWITGRSHWLRPPSREQWNA
jgi:hypothetical protein